MNQFRSVLFFFLSLGLAWSVEPDSLFYLFKQSETPIFTEADSLVIYHPSDQLRLGSDSSQSDIRVQGQKSFQLSVDQGLGLSQGLQLKIEGQIDSNTQIEAYLNDQSNELQAQRYSGTLKEFDQVYLKIFHSLYQVNLGDIQFQDEIGLKGVWGQSMRGLEFKYTPSWGGTHLALGASKSLYANVLLETKLGQQGGYYLQSSSGQVFSIKPSSEKVYLDGELLTPVTDYYIDYFEGLLHFTPQTQLQDNQRVRVQFEYWSQASIEEYSAISQVYRSENVELGGWRYQKSREIDSPTSSQIIIQDPSDLDSLISLGSQYYRLEGEVYTFVELVDLNIGDTIYQPRFTYNTLGSYQIITEQVGIGQEFYQYVGEGKGNYSLHQETEDFDQSIWSGAFVDAQLFPLLSIQLEFQDINTSFPEDQSPEETSQAYYVRIGSSPNLGTSSHLFDFETSFSRSDSLFKDFNQGDGLGEHWEEWGLQQSLIPYQISESHYAGQLKPGLNWRFLIQYDELLANKQDSTLNSQKTQGQIDFTQGKFKQEIKYEQLEAHVEEVIFKRNRFESQSLFQGDWVEPSFQIKSTKRGRDTLFQENILKPGVTYHLNQADVKWEQTTSFSYREVDQEGGLDSLQAVSVSEGAHLNLGKFFNWNHQMHWTQENLSLYEIQSREYWLANSDISYWNSQSFLEGELSYDQESTLGNYLIPIYSKVNPGTGNVKFDSLTQSYVHDIDRGDFIISGYSNDTTQANQLQKKIHLSYFLKLNTKPLFSVQRGFLAYSQFGFKGDFYTADTAELIQWLPELNTEELTNYYESRVHYDFYYQLDNNLHRFTWWRTIEHQFTQGLGLTQRELLKDDLSLVYQMTKQLSIEPAVTLTSELIQDRDQIDWTRLTSKLSYQWPRFFYSRPFWEHFQGQYQINLGDLRPFRMEKVGFELAYQRAEVGIAEIRSSWIHLNRSDLPYSMTQGFDSQWSYEMSSNVHLKISKNIYTDMNYLYIWSFEQRTEFQKLLLEMRALF